MCEYAFFISKGVDEKLKNKRSKRTIERWVIKRKKLL